MDRRSANSERVGVVGLGAMPGRIHPHPGRELRWDIDDGLAEPDQSLRNGAADPVLTTIFPGAECVTIEGADSGVMALDAGLVAELAAGFITGTPIAASAERRLVAVLFTDLVESTPTAAAVGDAVWRSTLDRYEAGVHSTVQRHHGTVVKRTGDGALATFPSGSEAIAAAVELRSMTRDLGLEGRTGVHVAMSFDVAAPP